MDSVFVQKLKKIFLKGAQVFLYLELKLSYLYRLAIRINFLSQVIVVKCWT